MDKRSSMTLTTAEQEQLYDLQKSGELYIKAEGAPSTQENRERHARLSNLKAGIGQRVDASARTAVVAERCLLDDDLDPQHGTAVGTDYRCGETSIHFPDDGSTPALHVFDEDFTLDLTRRDLSDLFTLLNDPRVKAAQAAHEAL